MTDKQFETTLKLIQDLSKTSQVQTPEPKIIQDLQKIVEARKALEEKSLGDVFKDLGINLRVTENGLFRLVDLSQGLTDNFGIFYDEVREQLAGNATKSVKEFGTVVSSVLATATEFSKKGIISPESFNALKQITDQYTQFNKLIQTSPDVAKAFDAETLNKFLFSTRQILIAIGSINISFLVLPVA